MRARETQGTGVALPALRQRRLDAFYTQAALAALAGVSRATVGEAEQGQRISRTNARKIAAALGISPQQLLNAPDQERARSV